MNLALFALGVLAVLATPGPTNTLLMTSGAEAGVKRSLPLVLGELSGYLISVNIIAFLMQELLHRHAAVELLLRGACAAYLLYTASKLWLSASGTVTLTVVSVRRIFITTLSNPKALVFALMIAPHALDRATQIAVLEGPLAGLILCSGVCWMAVGSFARNWAGPALNLAVIRRTSAAVLCVFAIIICASAWPLLIAA
jgi:threonine/homoserine/homoserine lactone efflux protein